jgi:hypothetical protein
MSTLRDNTAAPTRGHVSGCRVIDFSEHYTETAKLGAQPRYMRALF